MTLLMVFAFLLLWGGTAHADPVSLTAAGITSLLATAGITISATAANLAATAVLFAGSIAAQFALGRRGGNRPVIEAKELKNQIEIEESPQIYCGGRVRVAGVLFLVTQGGLILSGYPAVL
jgi:hypothetical protein